MTQEYAMSSASEDGGVSLPTAGSMEIDYGSEASSAGSSDMTSELPTHSAHSSDISSPSVMEEQHQHQLNLTIGVDASGEQSESMEDLPTGHTTILNINVPLLFEGPLDDAILGPNDPPSPSTVHPIATLYVPDPDPWPMEDTSNENTGQGDSASISEADEGNLDGSPPTPISVSHNDAHMLSISHEFVPTTLDHDIDQFLQIWRLLWLRQKANFPCISDEGGSLDIRHKRGRVSAKSMRRARCTMQGIDWTLFQTTSSLAREMRRRTCRNFTSMSRISFEQPLEAYATRKFKACFSSDTSPPLSHTDYFFRFHETNLKYTPVFGHYQLRNCLSATSKNAVFFYEKTIRGYPTNIFTVPPFDPYIPKVRCFNPETDSVREVIDLHKRHGPGFFRHMEISCLHADNDLLIVGALREGNYAMKSLSNTCDDTYVQGLFSNRGDGAGVNHVHTFLPRHSGVPHAVFCDNDSNIRIVDCNTNQQIQAQKWPSYVNCSATSPDGRLRIHVSDDAWPIVAEAETGRVIARLPGHKDHGFACDWSPDGMTMATGHQDGQVQVWDARKMKSPVHILPAEMGGIRSLHFSPLGSGHPVLVMAEPVDFVSIVDARTFQSKQDIEFFGEISGASMSPDGNSLFIGNADRRYGGIMEFERTGHSGQFKDRKPQCSSLQQRKNQRRQAVYNTSPEISDEEDLVEEASPEAKLERKYMADDQDATIWRTRGHDWAVDADIHYDRRVKLSRKQRWHRHLGLEKMVF